MAFGVALHITYDSIDGFTLLHGFEETLKQNFKMLILTLPGERVMDPEFGVGVTRYLFENENSDYKGKISAKIYEQVKRYMPVITIESIDFYGLSQDENSISMRIVYSVPDIGFRDLLEFTI